MKIAPENATTEQSEPRTCLFCREPEHVKNATPEQPEPPTCLFCGEPERAEIFEIWDHALMLETCCDALHEQIAFEMTEDPAWARHLLRQLGLEALSGRRLRRVADDGACGLVLDWQLHLHPIGVAATRCFITRHHAHCGPPVTWRFHVAISNGRTLLGVAVVGNPVARAFMNRGIVEVNRLCIRRDTPSALRWDAASMLYGWCAREAARHGWRKIITYTRADEPGTSLQAAGWVKEAQIHGRGWHGTTRRRSNRNAWIDKVRWSRTLAPRAQASNQAERTVGWSGFTLIEPVMDGLVFASLPESVRQRSSSSPIATRPSDLLSPRCVAGASSSTARPCSKNCSPYTKNPKQEREPA